MDDKLLHFEKSIKNLSDVDNRIHSIINNYKHETKAEYEDKKSSC